jgi:hypothetical protein
MIPALIIAVLFSLALEWYLMMAFIAIKIWTTVRTRLIMQRMERVRAAI